MAKKKHSDCEFKKVHKEMNEHTCRALMELNDELAIAESKHAKFNSAHEGFAVLHEEFDELKEHVWKKSSNRNIEEMRKEAIQVAAMAVRFVLNVCDF